MGHIFIKQKLYFLLHDDILVLPYLLLGNIIRRRPKFNEVVVCQSFFFSFKLMMFLGALDRCCVCRWFNGVFLEMIILSITKSIRIKSSIIGLRFEMVKLLFGYVRPFKYIDLNVQLIFFLILYILYEHTQENVTKWKC